MSPPFALAVPFVLASRSPRRKKLLDALGIPTDVRPSSGPEIIDPELTPSAVVQALATDKACDIADSARQSLVLGADTIVVLDGDILGKPKDSDDAHHMLSRLSGQTHTVFTGLALVHIATNRVKTAVAATEVSFGMISSSEIARYVAGGSPLDKAGAYGIQDDAGALFIDSIKGDYYNVVGLPLRTLYLLIKREFADLLQE